MTLITFSDGKVVMKGDAVGTEQACCCEQQECDCSTFVSESSTASEENIINQPCCQAVCFEYRTYRHIQEEWSDTVTVCVPIGCNNYVFYHSTTPTVEGVHPSAACSQPGRVDTTFDFYPDTEDSAAYSLSLFFDLGPDCCVEEGSRNFTVLGGGPIPDSLGFDTLEVFSVTVVTGTTVVYLDGGITVDEYSICDPNPLP